jgi:hypothetical protein
MSEEDDDIPPAVAGEGDEPEIVSTYTRAEALADGTLTDVTARAKEAGIKIPTAVTRAVWNDYIALTPTAAQVGNNVEGRLWDIVWMLRCAVVRTPNQSELSFQLYVVTDRRRPSLVTLKALVGPGDNGEPVITIMLPNES